MCDSPCGVKEGVGCASWSGWVSSREGMLGTVVTWSRDLVYHRQSWPGAIQRSKREGGSSVFLPWELETAHPFCRWTIDSPEGGLLDRLMNSKCWLGLRR